MIKLNLIFPIFLFYITTNAQWVVQQVPTTNTLYDIYFANSTEGWVSGQDGIFHTLDGGSNWEVQYYGQAVHLSGIDSSELWATRYRDTLIHSINGGINWDIITINGFTDFDSTYYLATVYFYDINIGWIQAVGWKSGSYAYRLLKTTDRGNTWEMRTHPWLSSDAYIQFFDSLYGYRTGSSIPFFRTTDGGDTWEEVSWYDYMVTFNMQFLTKDIGWISIDGPVLTTSAISTTNGGEDWLFNITFQCSDLSTYLNFADTLHGWVAQWTCLYGGRTEIWHTFDGGSSWDLQFTFSPPFYFRPNKIFFVDSLHGWVVGEHGVILHTSNGGIIPVELISFSVEVIHDVVTLNWTTVTETNNSGFEILRFIQNKNEWDTIGFVPGFGTTTEPKSYTFEDNDVSYGVYYYRLKQLDFDGSFEFSNIVEITFGVPTEFLLEQNFPNPFNPSTQIKYSIVKDGLVTLKVYDVLGKEIAALVNEEKSPGIYTLNFDATNLSSGIYFYQLKAGNFIVTKKMILLR